MLRKPLSHWLGTLLSFQALIVRRLFFFSKKKKSTANSLCLVWVVRLRLRKEEKKHSIFLFKSSFFNGICCLKAFVQVSGVYRGRRFLDFSSLIGFLKMPEMYSGSYLDSNNIAMLSFYSCVVFSGKSNYPVASLLPFIHSANIYSTPTILMHI